jgi:hypothetical protein
MLITCGLDVEGEGESTLGAFAALSHIAFREIDFDFFDFFIFQNENATAYKESNALHNYKFYFAIENDI